MKFSTHFSQKSLLFVKISLFLALFLAPFSAFSAQNDQKTNLKNLENAIQSGKEKQQKLQKTATQIQAERNSLNQQIKVAAKQIQTSEAHLSSGEKKLSELEKDESRLRFQYDKRKASLATLLSALLKLEKNPPPALLTKPQDASNALRSAIILGKIVPEVKAQSDVIAIDLKKLNQIQAKLTTQQDELMSNTKALRKQRNYISKLLDQKLTLSNKTQDEILDEKQKMASLGQKAKNIRDLFDKIETKKQQDKAQATKLAKQLEVKRLAAIEAHSLKLKQATAKQNSQEISQISNKINALKNRKPRVAHSIAPFKSLKRKLPFPAQGRLIRKFGEKNDQGIRAEGINISTRPFAQITSPTSGKIVFADRFKNYGHLIVIDVGSGYNIILSGLGDVVVQPNQFVEQGDPVGLMPKTAAFTEGSKPVAPILFVEFRKSGKSIDPTSWWNAKLARN